MGQGQQLIFVCTDDAVLAKKIRFLLARDDYAVETGSDIRSLERKIESGQIALLIASHELGGKRMPDVLSRWSKRKIVPSTIILGGSKAASTPNFMTIVPDPGDTTTVYQLASKALEAKSKDDEDFNLGHYAGVSETEGDLDRALDRTLTAKFDLGASAAAERGGLLDAEFPSEDALLDALGSRLGDEAVRQDDDQVLMGEENTAVGDDETESFDAALYRASTANGDSMAAAKHDNLGLKGPLEPGALGKALFQCWTMEARGALILSGEHEKLTVYFEDGFPVHIVSNVEGDPLGRTLVQRGSLSEEQYSHAAKRAIERGSTLSQSIVELGFLSRETLGHEQGEDAHERIILRFGERGGSFEFEANRTSPLSERPYRVAVGRLLMEGFRKHCPDESLGQIVANVEARYFKVRSPVEVLAQRFPLTERERAFLAFSGRAYNAADASEVTGLNPREARVLMALLMTCEEVDDFTPGVAEFEARIREERARASIIPQPAPPKVTPAPSRVLKTAPVTPSASSKVPGLVMPPPPPPMRATAASARDEDVAGLFDSDEPSERDNFELPTAAEVPAPTGLRDVRAAAAPTPTPSHAPMGRGGDASTNGRGSIPPMPFSAVSTRTPRSVVFSPPVPRTPDGQPQETPERQRSREHFQQGVGLLGQGNFDDAEEQFREAIALCAEEHVYLIGLARAIYYNPSYSASGKVPVLRTIVDRARHLAPEDARVTTLNEWISYAESSVSFA